MARLSKGNVDRKKRGGARGVMIILFSCTAQDTKPKEFHPHHSSQPSVTAVLGDPTSSGLQGARHTWYTDINSTHISFFKKTYSCLQYQSILQLSCILSFQWFSMEPVPPLPKHVVCQWIWSRTMLSMPASHRWTFRCFPPSTVTHQTWNILFPQTG